MRSKSLTITQAAKLIGCSVDAVRQYTKEPDERGFGFDLPSLPYHSELSGTNGVIQIFYEDEVKTWTRINKNKGRL